MTEITVTLPDELLESIDQTAQAQQRTRNDLLRDAAERYLREQGIPHRWEDPTVLRAVATLDRLAQQYADADWDPVRELRRFREERH